METRSKVFAAIPESLDDLKAGKMIIVVDDEDRENEGDFIMAADKVTPEAVNFMTKYGRGMICVPTTQERLEELGLPDMVDRNTAKLGTAFTVSVDAANGTTTGISAADRAATIKVFVDPDAKPEDLARPGHIHPLRAEEGGVLVRAGHTEAVVDLVRLAGLGPAGVLCEILSEDGSMERLPELIEIAERWDMRIVTIADIIKYRRRNERLVFRFASCRIPTQYGEFTAHGYQATVESNPYIALVMGDVTDGEPTLVRIHSGCFTGDVLGSLRCDCGDQLHEAMRMIGDEGRGVILYIYHQEGRGIGLVNKLKAYVLQDHGADTVEANQMLGFPGDIRDYSIGAQVLVDLGLKKIRLMTNNPAKFAAVQGYDLEIVERVGLVCPVNEDNARYLNTKRERMGHLLNEDLFRESSSRDLHAGEPAAGAEQENEPD
ncbi:MAG: bifunctional 3,4-dihydroxy-2-butanone 4-phosphate synthase/GTP cyclohydrolase II [Armatimonadetes bacterium RBG_16_58_9]|nr:MAG: bifunctional 3,4-dihydroxy-2-butanone 4-phosphate synthase/GTP cyclohydrolase II [Armatimonadetes bacterium RBG_16_58_9]